MNCINHIIYYYSLYHWYNQAIHHTHISHQCIALLIPKWFTHSTRAIRFIIPITWAGCVQTGAILLHDHTGNWMRYKYKYQYIYIYINKFGYLLCMMCHHFCIPMYLYGFWSLVNTPRQLSTTVLVQWLTLSCW